MVPAARLWTTTMTATSICLSPISRETIYLYHNERNGSFKAATDGDIVNEGASESYGVAWGDFDNDGFPDLFVSNGYDTGKTNFLYRNIGGGTFTKITNGAIVGVSGHFIGCAWADYDRDGFIDL